MSFNTTKTFSCKCRDCGKRRRVTGAEIVGAGRVRCYECGATLDVTGVTQKKRPGQLSDMSLRELRKRFKQKGVSKRERKEIVAEIKRRKPPSPPKDEPITKRGYVPSQKEINELIRINRKSKQ